MSSVPLDPLDRPHSVSGAVLAGGRSRRMGRDKRTIDVAGRPLLARAVDALQTAVGEVVVIVSEGDEASLDHLVPGVRIITDLEPDAGPLGGLLTALTSADTDVVVVVAGDHPALAPAVLRELERALLANEHVQAALLGTDRGPQALLGAYRREAAPVIRGLLERDEHRAQVLADLLSTVTLPESVWRELDPAGATALDLDTPADVASFADASDHRDPHDLDGDTRTGHQHRGRSLMTVVQVRAGAAREVTDPLVREEPLELRAGGPGQDPVTLLTTLRTPGHERDLVLGWLVTEGLLRAEDAPRTELTFADPHLAARPDDTITVSLPHPLDLPAAAERRATATASCGVCGRASIEELAARCEPLPPDPADATPLPWSLLVSLPDRLREAQTLFETTGGLHATGTFTRDGDLVTVREDVGRHNALDAAIGAHVQRGELPLHDLVGVLSGRVGFELVAKAATAGLPVLVAVGAPTDLAVRTAERLRLTLVGFVRGGDGNVYSHPGRIDLHA